MTQEERYFELYLLIITSGQPQANSLSVVSNLAENDNACNRVAAKDAQWSNPNQAGVLQFRSDRFEHCEASRHSNSTLLEWGAFRHVRLTLGLALLVALSKLRHTIRTQVS